MDRVRWRSKQLLDFTFLMMYAMRRGTYYVQLEDDVITKRGFVSTMNQFALKMTAENKPWWVQNNIYKKITLTWVHSDIHCIYICKCVWHTNLLCNDYIEECTKKYESHNFIVLFYQTKSLQTSSKPSKMRFENWKTSTRKTENFAHLTYPHAESGMR